MVSTSLFALAMTAVILVTVPLGYVAWQRREKTGARTLAVLTVAVSVWTAVELVKVPIYQFGLDLPLVELAATPVGASMLWTRLVYVGITTTVFAWFVFTAEYTGRGSLLSRRNLGLLAVEPVLINLVIWVRPEWIWADVVVNAAEPGGFRILEHGWAFWVHTVYSYALLLVGIYFLLRLLYRSQNLYRGQAAAVIVAVVAPLSGNAVYLADLTPLDVTPVGFAVSGIAFWYAVFRFEFMDLAPVARDTVVDNIGDGVLVLDDDDRVIDINPRCRAILGVEEGNVIGEPLSEILADYPEVVERYEGVTQMDDEITVDTGQGVRHFDVQVSPLSDGRGNQSGRLFLIHDVTDRKRRQEELERQNEQLDQFASLVSHDLRNPLNVADGYLQTAIDANDDEAVGRYLAEVGRSHDRMGELIDDVLTLARQGQTVENPEPVPLADVARRAWENVDTKDATMTVADEATVSADAGRLKRAFENLFRNAVEHGSTSPQTGTGDAVEHGSTSSQPSADDAVDHGAPDVAVRVGTIGNDDISLLRPGEQGFYVEDDGPGIDPDHRDQVLEDGYTTAKDGTGLGLSIVTSIVEAHGWSLSIAESGAGGARFEITGVELVESAPAMTADDD